MSPSTPGTASVAVDVPLPPQIEQLVTPFCRLVDWEQGTAAGADTTALFTYGHPQIDGALMDSLPQLKVISNFGVGVDHIDLEAATERKIPVGNTPGAVDGATADLTMTLLLATARNVVIGDRFARSDQFTFYDPSILHGADVYGSTLGIIGMGAIGREVAKRARGFDMRVLYHNRNRDPETEQRLGVEYATLQELLGQSQFVSLNLPLTPESRHIIGAAELQQMREDAILVNTARGGVVDQDALVRALREGWIAAAGLDVTEPEPLPRDHPLLALDNIIILPHLGSAAVRTRLRMAEMSVDNLRSGLEGRPLSWSPNT